MSVCEGNKGTYEDPLGRTLMESTLHRFPYLRYCGDDRSCYLDYLPFLFPFLRLLEVRIIWSVIMAFYYTEHTVLERISTTRLQFGPPLMPTSPIVL